MNNKSSKTDWICPNDRQLTLRSKLRIGWSVRAEQYERLGQKPKPLSEEEKESILAVIKRAEEIDKQEQERIGCLVDRLDNMKRNTLGTGEKQCVLCGDKFGFILGSSCLVCHDCSKSVCSKCGVEVASPKDLTAMIWLCKICAETRETWKKSGAWFYKCMPKYVLPSKSNASSAGNFHRYDHNRDAWRKVPSKLSADSDLSKEEEETSSEDEIRSTLSAPARYKLSTPNSSPIAMNDEIKRYSVNTSHNTPQHLPNYHDHRRASKASLFESTSSFPRISINNAFSSEESRSNSKDLSESDVGSLSSGIGSNQGMDEAEEEPLDTTLTAGRSSSGTIELSIQYDPDANCLHIALHRCKALKGTDINGLSDPFCKLNLLPVGAKSYRLKTRTIPKTVNPEFKETLTFYGISEGYLVSQSLHILILDADKYGHSCLGEAKFPLNKLKPRVTRDLCLNLEKHVPGDAEDEVWGEGFCSHGQITLTLSYSTRRRALIVGIIRCENLLPMDNNGLSDPFVKLWLKSEDGPSSAKYKTTIKWKNLNPVFNEEFAVETKFTDLSKKTLVLTVWDKDHGRTNDYLGSLQLGCHSKGDRLRQWLDAIKYPDHRHEGTHNLSDEFIKN